MIDRANNIFNHFVKNWRWGMLSLAFLVFFPFPDFKEGLIWEPISNSAHLLIGFFLYFFGRFSLIKKYSSSNILEVVFLFFSIGFAAMIEFLQPYFGRGMSMEDLQLSFLGSLSAYLFQIGTQKAAIVSMSLGVIFAVIPLVKGINMARLKWAQFPIIVTANSELNKIIKPVLDVDIKVNTESCAVKFKSTGKFSGIDIPLSSQDWSRYQMLNISIRNLSAEAGSIGLRIDDIGDCKNFEDRFNRRFTVPSGHIVLSIPVLDIKNSVSPKDFQIDEVKRIVLFDGDVGGVEYCLESIELR